MSRLTFTIRTSDPVSPNPGQVSLYAKGIFLYYEDSNGVVTQINTGNTGTVTGAQNLGTGDGLFASVSGGGTTLDFKSLKAGTNITLTPSGTEILIDATGGSGEVNTASNIGTGTGIFASKVLFDLQFKSLKNGAGIGITSDADSVTITSSITQGFTSATTAGTGNSIIKTAVVPNLILKTLKNGTGISFGITADEITINSDGVLSLANVGSGNGIWRDTIAGVASLKSLVQGTGIVIGAGTDSMTISSTITQGYTTANNAGGGISLINSSVVPTLTLKTLAQGSGITINDTGGLLTISSTITAPITSVVSTKAGLFQIANPTGPAVGIDSIPLVNIISTGLLSGGLVTQASSTTVNVASLVGRFTNNYTNIAAPTFADLTYGPFNAVTLTNIATNSFTILSVTPAGVLNQSITLTDTALNRTGAILGTVFHPNGAISAITQRTNSASDYGADSADLFSVMGAINQFGNVFSANGANLNINKTIGNFYSLGVTFKTTPLTPNIIANPALTALSFNYAYRSNTGSAIIVPLTIAINPTQYDNGTGTLAAVGANNYSIQKVYLVPATNQVLIMYGQAIYATLAEAIDGVTTENWVRLFGYNNIALRGFIILKGNATQLNNTAQAIFQEASRFGDLGGGGGGGGGAPGGLSVDGLPKWSYSSTTTDADPGPGFFRLNAVPASATIMYINYSNSVGANLKTILLGLATNSGFFLPVQNSSGIWQNYLVSGAITDAATYLKIPITLVNGGTAYANNDVVEFNILNSVPSGFVNVAGAAKLETCSLNSLSSFESMASTPRWAQIRTGSGAFKVTKITIYVRQAGGGSNNINVGVYNWASTGSVARIASVTALVTVGADQAENFFTFTLPSPVTLAADTSYFAAATSDGGILQIASFGGRLGSAGGLLFQETGQSTLPANTAGGARIASGMSYWIQLS